MPAGNAPISCLIASACVAIWLTPALPSVHLAWRLRNEPESTSG
jgi:hypothetical protein